ncbi:MAG: P-loop NTPase fold protein [Bacteroidota bacterium]
MKPYIIGITGGSGSGKTTFINALRNQFSEADLCIVSQDHYYRTREEQQIDDHGKRNFDLPESFDAERFEQDLKAIISGTTIQKEEYVYNNKEAEASTIHFCPAPILILEGIFVFHFEAINQLIDLRIFVEARENLKIIRRIQRDRTERNYPIDDVLYRYQYHVSPAYDRYIAPHRDKAHLVVNNNENFDEALNVVTGFLNYRLQQTKE